MSQEFSTQNKIDILPLHIAAQKDDANSASILIQNGEDIKATDSLGRTALHIAAEHGSTNIIPMLLAGHYNMLNSKRSDINAKITKDSPLYIMQRRMVVQRLQNPYLAMEQIQQ